MGLAETILLLGLTCTDFASEVRKYYYLRYRSSLEMPKSFLINDMPRREAIIEFAYSYPDEHTSAWVEIDAEDKCLDMSDN